MQNHEMICSKAEGLKRPPFAITKLNLKSCTVRQDFHNSADLPAPKILVWEIRGQRNDIE